jgi:hypothetical protein
MSSTVDYVADHIDRIARRHGGKESLILSSKWRIASSLSMFGNELNPNYFGAVSAEGYWQAMNVNNPAFCFQAHSEAHEAKE